MIEFSRPESPESPASDTTTHHGALRLRRGGMWSWPLLAAILFVPSQACVVPVYRYALERWYPDSYQVWVLRNKVLSPGDSLKLEALKRPDAGSALYNANYAYQEFVDGDNLPSEVRGVFQGVGEQRPWVTAFFPFETTVQETLLNGPLQQADFNPLIESPARREIGRRITQGETAVWVLLGSGDAARDSALSRRTAKLLDSLEKTVELSEVNELNRPGWFDLEGGPELKVHFSILPISRNDSKEHHFLKMLSAMHEDVGNKKTEAFLIPIFGRGRALEVFSESMINPASLSAACSFLAGYCSCEVKAMNPGMDMLFAYDWESFRTHATPMEEMLPPLSGFSDFVPEEQQESESHEREEPEPAPKPEPEAKKVKAAAPEPEQTPRVQASAETIDAEEKTDEKKSSAARERTPVQAVSMLDETETEMDPPACCPPEGLMAQKKKQLDSAAVIQAGGFNEDGTGPAASAGSVSTVTELFAGMSSVNKSLFLSLAGLIALVGVGAMGAIWLRKMRTGSAG